ncbi:MAG: hypothetical protein IJ419_11885 [Agathobacter sp.]|nr:hypothetical protein [Agathobacter sp.]
MAKNVQIKKFLNPEQIQIGQPAKFLGYDGLEYQTNVVEHFNMYPDGRIDITTLSGSKYANYDMEAQRIKEHQEYEASRTPEDRLAAAQTAQRYMLQNFNRKTNYVERSFYEEAAQHVGNVNAQYAEPIPIGHVGFDPSTALLWRNGSDHWEQFPTNPTLEDLQTGYCIYFPGVTYTDSQHPNEPVVYDMQTQIREAGVGPNGQFWIDTSTHVITNSSLDILQDAIALDKIGREIGELAEQIKQETEQDYSHEVVDQTDIFG